jgi:hypothetical protein
MAGQETPPKGVLADYRKQEPEGEGGGRRGAREGQREAKNDAIKKECLILLYLCYYIVGGSVARLIQKFVLS